MRQPRVPIHRRLLRCSWDVLLHGVCHRRPAGRHLRVLAVSCVLSAENRGRREAPAVQSFQPQTVFVCPSEWYYLVSMSLCLARSPCVLPFLTVGNDSFLTRISRITDADATEPVRICKRRPQFRYIPIPLVSSVSSLNFPPRSTFTPLLWFLASRCILNSLFALQNVMVYWPNFNSTSLVHVLVLKFSMALSSVAHCTYHSLEDTHTL